MSLCVAVTGATGFVGGLLLPALRAAGHQAVALVRERRDRDAAALAPALGASEARGYDPLDAASAARALEGCTAVVNLAGESVLGGRWSPAYLARLNASRIDTTKALVVALGMQGTPASVLVSASAVGWYGARAPETPLTEATARAGDDELARLCQGWEEAALGAERLGTRVALLRFGVVLGRGGALAKMERAFRWGLGGRLGHGRQAMSWIHADDLVRVVLFALEQQGLHGPVNATAPAPVSNREFTRELARALRRPAFLPVPACALRLLVGRGSKVLTTGQRVLPAVLEAAGFSFRYPTLAGALADIYPPER